MDKTLPACPVETTLSLISDRWKVLIIRDLLGGTKRFGELRKSVGSVYAEVPPRVEYTLTETGMSLRPVLDAMQTWGESYKEKRAGGETA